MILYSPDINLETLYILDADRRIVSTREPYPSPGPQFTLIRGKENCTWAVHTDVPADIARELDRLVPEEPPVDDPRIPPVNAEHYAALLDGRPGSGPMFIFPAHLPPSRDAVPITDLSTLNAHFTGWVADEIEERSPIMAVMDDGGAVSICFCARRSEAAAEAGVETAEAFRGRGLAGRVIAAWADVIRTGGRLPIYSTSWDNLASIKVARKLGLERCADYWSIT